jgi:hypothetical protein
MFLYVNSIKKYNLLFYLLIGMDENERRRIRKRTSNFEITSRKMYYLEEKIVKRETRN